VLYISISIAAVNTQYFAAFLLLSNWIILLIKGHKRTIILYLVDMFFVLVSLSWTLLFLSNQINLHLYGDRAINFEGIIRFIPARLDVYSFYRDLFPFKIAGYIFEFIIVITILFYIISRRQIKNFFENNFYYIIQTIIISLCFIGIYPLLGNEFLAIRHTAILFIPVFLLLLRLFDYFQNKYLKGVLVISVFLFYFSGSYNYYRLLIKDLDI
jgi:hypothetical protein